MNIKLKCSCGAAFEMDSDDFFVIQEPDEQCPERDKLYLAEIMAFEWLDRHQMCSSGTVSSAMNEFFGTDCPESCPCFGNDSLVDCDPNCKHLGGENEPPKPRNGLKVVKEDGTTEYRKDGPDEEF
jgi:hypothetical protein